MKSIQCGRFVFPANQPIVMGIVNVTPDSFSDGGRYHNHQHALAHARSLVAQGATILDIGGESTRPGAETVSVDEELSRVMPILEALKDDGVALSLDTYKTEVMEAALAAGVVDLINDVNALESEGAIQAVLKGAASVCLMHKKGTPQTMQDAPKYYDVEDEVDQYLQARVSQLTTAGFPLEKIWLDPGFGFGKTLEHNIELMKQLPRFVAHQLPVLVGVSRKTMIGQITALPVDRRAVGSAVAAVIAIRNGAHIVRVHDVEETVAAIKVWECLS